MIKYRAKNIVFWKDFSSLLFCLFMILISFVICSLYVISIEPTELELLFKQNKKYQYQANQLQTNYISKVSPNSVSLNSILVIFRFFLFCFYVFFVAVVGCLFTRFTIPLKWRIVLSIFTQLSRFYLFLSLSLSYKIWPWPIKNDRGLSRMRCETSVKSEQLIA